MRILIVVASSDTFVVPEGTKVIGANSFSYYEKLKKVILPKSLEKIEGWAFSGCDNLAEVQGLDDVKNVDTKAFGWGGFKKK